MRRRLAIVATVLALGLAACGGDDDKASTAPAPSDTIEAPSGGAPPPAAPGGLPPEFVQCMTDKGFDVEGGADIHTAPQEVLQECFGSLHGN